jgi:hypothetical protein
MAIGVTIPDASVQPISARMLGQRSLILSFFESTEAQPEYKNNHAWIEPINQDAKGLSACTTRMFMAFLTRM